MDREVVGKRVIRTVTQNTALSRVHVVVMLIPYERPLVMMNLDFGNLRHSDVLTTYECNSLRLQR